MSLILHNRAGSTLYTRKADWTVQLNEYSVGVVPSQIIKLLDRGDQLCRIICLFFLRRTI